MSRFLRALAVVALVLLPVSSTVAPLAAASTTCSSPLRLYDGANRTGTQLSTSIRWTYVNLANSGFDNRTSSFSTGACWVELYSGPYGSGSAWTVGPWTTVDQMGGWSNIVSSLYIG